MGKINLNQADLVTAITGEVARQCPRHGISSRQINSLIDAANDIVREFARDEKISVPGEGIQSWRRTDQVGASADFMAAKLGNAGIRDYAHPRDPSDFGRCLTLLEAAPELREQLPEMSKESAQWAALVANWDELESLFVEGTLSGEMAELYEWMKKLLHSEWSE